MASPARFKRHPKGNRLSSSMCPRGFETPRFWDLGLHDAVVGRLPSSVSVSGRRKSVVCSVPWAIIFPKLCTKLVQCRESGGSRTCRLGCNPRSGAGCVRARYYSSLARPTMHSIVALVHRSVEDRSRRSETDGEGKKIQSWSPSRSSVPGQDWLGMIQHKLKFNYHRVRR